jgi:hypothetical protein
MRNRHFEIRNFFYNIFLKPPQIAPLIGYLVVAAGTAIGAAIASNSSKSNAASATNASK